MNLRDHLLYWLDRVIWGGPHEATSTAVPPNGDDLGRLLEELQRQQREAARAADQRVMYCPRCCQHLPLGVFWGHTATIYASRDLWPPHEGFTLNVIAHSGGAAPCPGGQR